MLIQKHMDIIFFFFPCNLVFAILIILQMPLKVGVLPQNLSTGNGHIYPFGLKLVWTLILVLI